MTESAGRVYLLWGEDTLSRDEVVQSFKSRMLSRPAGELNVVEYRAPDVSASELIAACDTVPFLSDRRLVIVHRLFSWRGRAGSRRQPDAGDGGGALKAEREAFLAYLPRLAPHTTLLLVEAGLSPAHRGEIVRAIPRSRANVRDFPAPQGFDLERWLTRRAHQHGGELGPRVAGLLREHGPSTLEGLDRELAKLVTYAGDAPVSVADLNELLAGGEIVVFELLDAIAEGRPEGALVALRRLLQQGQRPEELAPQIIALYRRLLVCRLAMAERVDPATIQRIHSVKMIEKLRLQARRSSAGQLEASLERLLEFDRRLKRGDLDPEAGLELLVSELAEGARAGALETTP